MPRGARETDRSRVSILTFVVLSGCAPGRVTFDYGSGDSTPQGGDDTTVEDALDLPTGCNPLLGGIHCSAPYPSDVFRVEDASFPSGYRVDPEGAAELETTTAQQADASDWRPMDGFSRDPLIVTAIGSGIDPAGVVGVSDNPDTSIVLGSSPTLIVDAEDGSFIPHFADVDPRAVDPALQALELHPREHLKANHRYIVAIVGLLKDGGGIIDPPEGFRRLRDHVAGDPDVDALAGHFNREVFPVLTRAGIPRSQLQLAWDFTTGTSENVRSDLLTMRADTLAFIASNPPAVTITSVDEPGSLPGVWRTIRGTITVPNYLDGTSPGSVLARDANHKVVRNGTVQVPFAVQIPTKARDQYQAMRVIAKGHGFFESYTHILTSGPGYAVTEVAADIGALVVGIDWWGMTSSDRTGLGARILTAPAEVAYFTERVAQSMMSWITVIEAFATVIPQDPSLTGFYRPTDPTAPGVVGNPNGSGDNAGRLIYDPSRIYFWGMSLGHILGGTLAALDPHIERWVLTVGGEGLSHIAFRSSYFNDLLDTLDEAFADPIDSLLYLASLQRLFDRVGSDEFSELVFDAPLPGSPPRKVLMQMGLGDMGVPNLATLAHARALGLSVTSPTPLAPWRIPEAGPPVYSSAITIFDFGADLSFYDTPVPPPSDITQVHLSVETLPEVREQIDEFLKPNGSIIHPCSGPCEVSVP